MNEIPKASWMVLLRHASTMFVSVVTVIGLLWGYARPRIVDDISDAVIEKASVRFEERIRVQLRPVHTATRSMIAGNMITLRRQIARLEYKSRTGTFTEEDAVLLADLNAEMYVQQTALNGLNGR